MSATEWRRPDGIGGTFAEGLVSVSTAPAVSLFVARSDGPANRTLLVIHGGPDWDHGYLRELLAELAGRHRLVLPDLRGCGRSTQGLADHQYNPDAVVSDLTALLDALGVDNADVLGFSYGGLIAQRLAVTAPHRVRRLILASTSVLPVLPDAFDGWAERDLVLATLVAPDPALTGPEFTGAMAVVSAPANI